MNLFSKVSQMGTAASPVAKAMGHVAATMTGSIAGKGFTAAGLLQMAAKHPLKASALGFAAGSLIASQSIGQQVNVPGPVTQMSARPGGYNSSNYDLGGTGDLVFALHKNR